MTICLFECLRRVVAALYVQKRNMKNNYKIMFQEPYMNQTHAATSKPRKAKGRGTPPPLELTRDAYSRQAKGYWGGTDVGVWRVIRARRCIYYTL